MLAISDRAAAAIDNLLASRELPDEAGVRITTQVGASGDGGPERGVQLQVVEAPEAGDEVLEDAAVFVEPEAAALLDDRLLDAELSGEKVRFALRAQE